MSRSLPAVSLVALLGLVGLSAARQDQVRTAPNVQNANVREEPRGDARVIGRLKAGEQAELLAPLTLHLQADLRPSSIGGSRFQPSA